MHKSIEILHTAIYTCSYKRQRKPLGVYGIMLSRNPPDRYIIYIYMYNNGIV